MRRQYETTIYFIDTTSFPLHNYKLKLDYSYDYSFWLQTNHRQRTRIFNLSHFNQITDKGLEYLKAVHMITLIECNQIINKGLEHLQEARAINIYCCDQITGKV